MRARLLLIGGSGAIGRCLAEAFRERFDVLIIDPQEPDFSAGAVWIRSTAAELPPSTIESGDIVVFAATGGAAGWQALLDTEIVGLRNVARRSAEVGVERFILLSSSRVAFAAEREIAETGYRDVAPAGFEMRTDTVRPLTEYGAAKAFAEAFVRMLAEERGLRTSVLRVGTFRTIDDAKLLVEEGIADMPMSKDMLERRLSATWLSHEGLLRMFEEELSAEEVFRRRFAVSVPQERTWLPLEVERWTA